MTKHYTKKFSENNTPKSYKSLEVWEVVSDLFLDQVANTVLSRHLIAFKELAS